MALVIETGAGVANADSYVTQAAFAAWVLSYWGETLTASTAVQEAALRRAALYLNTLSWSGTKTYARAQPLAWPRTDVTDCDGTAIGTGEIPDEVTTAQMQLARAEIASPGILSPQSSVSGTVKREKVDVIEIEYDTSRGTGSIDDQRVIITAALDGLRCFVSIPGARTTWAVVV